ncbi:MAG: pilus assembly protein PilM, partial [bacterium]
MRRDLFLSLFPSPTYFAVSNVGLDISDQSVKFIELLPHNGRVTIGRFGEQDIPAGVVEAGKIKKPEELEKILVELKEKYKISRAVVSLPEEQAYTIRVRLPFVNEDEIRDSLDLQLVELVPIPAASAVVDYDIYKRPVDEKGFYDLSVSVVPREMVESYAGVLTSSLFVPIALEIEAQALARAFIPKDSHEVVMIVDIGKTRTSISINVGQMVLYTSTVSNIGGDNITHSIEKNLHVTYEEAEKLKIEKGILRSSDSQDLFYSLTPVISTLKDEIM